MKWIFRTCPYNRPRMRCTIQAAIAITVLSFTNIINRNSNMLVWPVCCNALATTSRHSFFRTFPHSTTRRLLGLRSTGFTSSFPVEDMTGWTVDQVLHEATRQLAAANVTEPDLSVQHLLADSLHLSWKSGFRDIVHQRSTVLTSQQAADFRTKLQRRSKHEPLQYILGQWDFFDYTITVKSPLLCPRPETEELVMRIHDDHIKTASSSSCSSPLRILDVGCGTGVIGLSLLAMATKQHPGLIGFVQAIDIDSVAIETSRENALRILGGEGNEVDAEGERGISSRYQATLCSAQDYSIDDPDHRPFDIVVSNPPYIPRADMDGLSQDVRGYENDVALCGGEDGMDVIRTIVGQLRTWCHSGAVCWMEVDPTHPRLLEQWLSEEESKGFGVAFEAGYQDMFGKDRFVKLRVL